MRFRRSRAPLAPSTTLCALLLLATTVSAADRATKNVDFGAYPDKAQDCLYDAADASKCGNGKSVPEINNCFCNDGGDFVSQSAYCIEKASKGDMQKVFDTLTINCKNSGTPLSVSKTDFMAAKDPKGESSTTTTSKPKTSTTATSTRSSTSTSSTSSGTPTPTESPQNQNNGDMSSTAKTGIIAGASVAGVAILAAVGLFIWKRRRNHRDQDERHPMLPGGPGPRTSAMSTGAPQDWTHDPERESKWYAASDVSATTPHQSWGYNPGAPYAGMAPGQQQLSPYHSPHVSQQLSPPLVAPGMAHQPPVPQPAVFELGGGQGVASGPAEMPASPLDGGSAPQQPVQQPAAAGWAAYRPPPPQQ